MRKLFAFICILFVSVLCSACINNFAIQELNQKAKEYLDKGSVDDAISRLESSVDLDGTIFESRYNLGVAYIQKGENLKAQNELAVAIKIKPDSADAYYSLGVAQEAEGSKALEEKNTEDTDKDAVEVKNVESGQVVSDEARLSKDEALKAVAKLDLAILSYKKYLELSKNLEDSDKVKEHINNLSKIIDESRVKYELAPALQSEDAPLVQENKE